MTTSCPACNHSNPLDNRFCGMCGARLERRRMPDSELLPEDSDLGGLPAEALSEARVSYEPLFDDLTPPREEAQPRPGATPIGDKRLISETRIAESTRTPAIEEPGSGTFMGFELGQSGNT